MAGFKEESEEYGKIKSVPLESGGGAYPQNDIGKDDVMVKGKWPTGTKQKSYIDMRGAGAATKGKKFLNQ
jgi:hypothetical protein